MESATGANSVAKEVPRSRSTTDSGGGRNGSGIGGTRDGEGSGSSRRWRLFNSCRHRNPYSRGLRKKRRIFRRLGMAGYLFWAVAAPPVSEVPRLKEWEG